MPPTPLPFIQPQRDVTRLRHGNKMRRVGGDGTRRGGEGLAKGLSSTSQQLLSGSRQMANTRSGHLCWPNWLAK